MALHKQLGARLDLLRHARRVTIDAVEQLALRHPTDRQLCVVDLLEAIARGHTRERDDGRCDAVGLVAIETRPASRKVDEFAQPHAVAHLGADAVGERKVELVQRRLLVRQPHAEGGKVLVEVTHTAREEVLRKLPVSCHHA